LKEIATTKGWTDWPTEEQLRRLSEQADGLFHYAFTWLGWFKSELENRERDDLFQDATSLEMDNGAHESRRSERLRDFHLIMGCLIPSRRPHVLISWETRPFNIAELSALIDGSLEKTNVTPFFNRLRSIFVLSRNDIKPLNETIPDMHKSFRDYVTTEKAGEFRITESEAQLAIAKVCMQIVVAKPSMENAHQLAIEYAENKWAEHLSLSINVAEQNQIFDEKVKKTY